MPFNLTAEEIKQMAPDAASVKNGQKLATPRSWVSAGHNEQAVWGECKGSGQKPYQVQVDLSSGELAYRCSCPSRKQPCKHTLGLLLLLAENPAACTETDPPDRVTEWLARRSQKAQQRTEKQQQGGKVSDPDAQAKRAAAREAKIAAGMQELDLWLRDLVRQGLASVESRGATFWNNQAARMVDAQAPGVARMLRNLAGIQSSGEGWQERLLQQLGSIHLLIEGYHNLGNLPEATQHDIRTAIGIPIKEDDLLPLPGTRDQWCVIGQSLEDEDNLRVQRTWLWGKTSGKPALVLNFAFGNQKPDTSLIAGTMVDAELVFYPGNYPLRAIVKTRHAEPVRLDTIPGAPTINAAIGGYAAALAANPWIERVPLACDAVTVLGTEHGWYVRDSEQRALRIAPRFGEGWNLLALSGGHPTPLAGEWNGDTLLPLGLWVQGRFIAV
jgi:hypothetical protein